MSSLIENSVPLVSIIIPCYNDAEYIEQSVDSALKQTYDSKEIIIVDDGSNEETKKVLRVLESKITKLITQDNEGQSSARNVGIRNARGDYILVLDSDDFFEPTFCEKGIKEFNSSKNIKIVTCWANLIYENGQKELYKPDGGKIEDFLLKNCALGTSMLKKVDLDTCGGYDEIMRNGFEDWDLFIKLLKEGGEARVINEVLYNYRKRLDSTTFKANKKKYELLEYIYLKHKELFKSNFESLVIHLLYLAENEENEKMKIYKTVDYKIGYKLLKPFRFFKKLKLKALKKQPK